MWRSTFLPGRIFDLQIVLSICFQTHSDEHNWARCRTFHELNSPSLVRLIKNSTFGLAWPKSLWNSVIASRGMGSLSQLWPTLNQLNQIQLLPHLSHLIEPHQPIHLFICILSVVIRSAMTLFTSWDVSWAWQSDSTTTDNIYSAFTTGWPSTLCSWKGRYLF